MKETGSSWPHKGDIGGEERIQAPERGRRKSFHLLWCRASAWWLSGAAADDDREGNCRNHEEKRKERVVILSSVGAAMMMEVTTETEGDKGRGGADR